MARQDFQEMDPFGYRWQATMSVAIPLVDLASDLVGSPDDRVTEELRHRDFSDVPGIFDPRPLITVAERQEDQRGDLIIFDRIGRDKEQRPLVFARVVSSLSFRDDFVDRMRFGVHYTKHLSNYTGHSSRMRAVLGTSTKMTTSFRVTHVQHPDVPSFPGSAIGLDSAWRIAIGQAWRGTESGLRSVFAQRDHRLAVLEDAMEPWHLTREDYELEKSSTLPDSQKPAVRSDDESICVTGIPNGWLFDQARSCGPEGRANDMPLADLLIRTEVFLGLYDRRSLNLPRDELKRLQPILEMLQRRECQPHLRNEKGRQMIIYRGNPIGELNGLSRRVRFSPTREWDLWSCPIEEGGNIEAVLAAMILDAAWAREILDDGRHMSSFLGPIAEDYPDTNWHLNRDLLLDDGRDDRPNPFARFKRSALS